MEKNKRSHAREEERKKRRELIRRLDPDAARRALKRWKREQS